MLAAAVGKDGRDRKAASDSERARSTVTRSIKAALERIAEHKLGERRQTRRNLAIIALDVDGKSADKH